MELKKNAAYDLEPKTPLFFSIGLVIALALVTAAFEWRGQYEPLDLRKEEPVWEEPYIVRNTVIPAPKPPEPMPVKKQQVITQPPIIVEGNELESYIEYTEPIDDIPFDDIPIEPSPEVDNNVYMGELIETQASFPGGLSAFYEYVATNIKYPKRAKTMDVTGTVYVQFIIDKDGSLTELKTLKGIGLGCDEEAIRVLENSPKWNPGKQRGRAVRVRMVLPITFSLAH